MRKHLVPSDDGRLAISLGAAAGRKLESITIYQTQEALSVDLRFEEGFALELSFENRYRISAQALRFMDGDAELLADLTAERVHTR